MFHRKLVMIALGLANAVLFARLRRGRLDGWGDEVPVGARIAALGSLVFWLAAAAFGRLIAYV